MPTTLTHLQVELDAPEQLTTLLDAKVSASWPPGEYDRDAMLFFRDCLEKGGEEVVGWYGWYAIRAADAQGPRALVGAGGYFGPATNDGTVEIGYSVLPEWRRRGYASELVQALVANAFTFAHVQRVIAHTTQTNIASLGVLRRCGFQAAGSGAEPGHLRFVLTAAAP